MTESTDLLLESGLMLRSTSIVVDEKGAVSIELLLAREHGQWLRVLANGCENFLFESREGEMTCGPLCVVVRDISNWGWDSLKFEVKDLEREAFQMYANAVEVSEVEAHQ
jgi:hypothetical protein